MRNRDACISIILFVCQSARPSVSMYFIMSANLLSKTSFNILLVHDGYFKKFVLGIILFSETSCTEGGPRY